MKKEEIVAVWIPHLRLGGAEQVAMNLALALAESGQSVHLVVGDGEGAFKTPHHPLLDIVDLGVPRVSRAIGALRKYLKEHKPKGVISHLSRANVVLQLATAGLTSAPVTVLVEHATPHPPANVKEWVIQKLMRRTYGSADHVVAASNGNAEDVAVFLGWKTGSVKVIPNPVVSPAIGEASSRTVHHPWIERKGEPLIVTLGRLSDVKDHETLIRAFAEFAREQPGNLLIMGPGPLRDRLIALSESLGVQDRVELAGFVDNPYGILGRADLFVLSSRSEALPTALIEALACGCPAVSTDCRQGPREILLDGHLGELVPVGDVSALARAIQNGLERRVSRESLVARGNDYSFARAARDYLALVGLPDSRANMS